MDNVGHKIRLWRSVLWLSVTLLCLTLAGMIVYYQQGMAAVKEADEVTQYIRGRELFVRLLQWGVSVALLCVWGISFARQKLKKWRGELS